MYSQSVLVLTICAAICGPVYGQNQSGLEVDAFGKIVQPFFKKHCLGCHGADSPEAEFSLHELAGGSQFQKDAQRWERVLEMLASRQMPPLEEAQPSKQLRAQLVSWIKQQLIKAGHTSEWQRKLMFPEYGNYVDHESLFDGSVKAVGWSPSRLWKRSPYIFDSLVMRGIGLGKGRPGQRPAKLSKVKQPFTIEDKAGVKDFAAIMYAD